MAFPRGSRNSHPGFPSASGESPGLPSSAADPQPVTQDSESTAAKARESLMYRISPTHASTSSCSAATPLVSPQRWRGLIAPLEFVPDNPQPVMGRCNGTAEAWWVVRIMAGSSGSGLPLRDSWSSPVRGPQAGVGPRDVTGGSTVQRWRRCTGGGYGNLQTVMR